MDNFLILLLLIASPLIGFLLNGILYKKKNIGLAGGLGVASVLISFVASVVLFTRLQASSLEEFTFVLWKWFSVAGLNIDLAFSFNRISALMCLIITGVGCLIHLFSVEYMKDDDHPHKYFAYLNLFIFNMLVLVLGANLLVTFIGWEGVGLCSYLLIGYWYTDEEKASAGMKAFIANRIGDAGFIIGMIILYLNLGTLDYSLINELASGLGAVGWNSFQTFAVLSIFIGVAGKSAQLPLFVWLPDAMAGPTPVSALIHAATMVTSGIFVLFGLNGLLDSSPEAMFVIACTGALTAFVGAFIALSQWDIKKVLAYSTVSQLGYMVLAIGVGSYVGAVFHLLTHAFFKGLMFLGAGSVIHGLSGEQDMRNMGGLNKTMPVTHFSFLIGWLSIIGAPLFSGFFSKDEILYSVFHNEQGSIILWCVAILTAGLTAFYMTRLMAHVFWSEARHKKGVHPHEGSFLFQAPLVILAVFVVVLGFLGLPHAIGSILPGHPKHFLATWLGPVLVKAPTTEVSLLLEWVLMFVSVTVAASSAVLAYMLYIKKNARVDRAVLLVKKGVILRASRKLCYFDSFYNEKILAPFKDLSEAAWIFIDVEFIDRALVFTAASIARVGKISENFQTGKVQSYIAIFTVVTAFVLAGVLFI